MLGRAFKKVTDAVDCTRAKRSIRRLSGYLGDGAGLERHAVAIAEGYAQNHPGLATEVVETISNYRVQEEKAGNAEQVYLAHRTIANIAANLKGHPFDALATLARLPGDRSSDIAVFAENLGEENREDRLVLNAVFRAFEQNDHYGFARRIEDFAGKSGESAQIEAVRFLIPRIGQKNADEGCGDAVKKIVEKADAIAVAVYALEKMRGEYSDRMGWKEPAVLQELYRDLEDRSRRLLSEESLQIISQQNDREVLNAFLDTIYKLKRDAVIIAHEKIQEDQRGHPDLIIVSEKMTAKLEEIKEKSARLYREEFARSNTHSRQNTASPGGWTRSP